MIKGIDLTNGFIADLVRVNVRYVLEWRRNGEIHRAIGLPLPPQALRISQDTPALITHTIGGGVIRELSPSYIKTITLDGSAGYDARSAYNREGAFIFANGPAILNEFRAFLELYQDAAHDAPTDYAQRANISAGLIHQNELVFRALDEDTHARVEVESLAISRDAQSTHTAPAWSLTLKAYDTAPTYARPFDAYQSALESLTNAINQAAAAVALVGAALEGFNTLGRLALAPLEALANISRAALTITDAARNLVDIPSDIISRAAGAALNTRTAFTRLIDDVERFPAETGAAWEALKTAILGADEAQEQAERALGVLGRPIEPYTPEAPALTASELTPDLEETSAGSTASAAELYRLRLGEDLMHLARRLYGDATRWTELAELNGWLDAFTLPNGRTARAGDPLLIPTELEPQAARSSLGKDLALDNSGDLILSGADLKTISGPRNLSQALRLRVQTTRGELTHAPTYGLPRLIGRKLTASSAGYISAHIREQLTLDPRIERLSRLELTDIDNGLNIDAEAIATTGALISPQITRGL